MRCVASFACAGGSLLKGVQAEVRLLQEEVEETGKKRLFKIHLPLSGFVCVGTLSVYKDESGSNLPASILIQLDYTPQYSL